MKDFVREFHKGQNVARNIIRVWVLPRRLIKINLGIALEEESKDLSIAPEAKANKGLPYPTCAQQRASGVPAGPGNAPAGHHWAA